VRHLLIDTDTAGDDVTALLIALRSPDVTVEAITVVAGNVYLDQCVTNALYTTEMAKRTDVPVYVGAGKPLMRRLVTAHYVHGDDGMGNSNFPAPTKEPESTHAVDAIIELADRFPGELEIIGQGPLTNLALAVAKDPGLPSKVKRLIIMGGVNNARGNITPAAEFNFYVDPEAAQIVFRSGFDILLSPWDLCLRDGIIYRDEMAPFEALDTELSRFWLSVNRRAWEFLSEIGIDGVSLPDAITVALALDPSMILESAVYFVDVETKGEYTSGYSVVDVGGVVEKEPNAEVVVRFDKARFKDLLLDVLRG
jgi:inosine-uridine nucleoside N-ribohydrolase